MTNKMKLWILDIGVLLIILITFSILSINNRTSLNECQSKSREIEKLNAKLKQDKDIRDIAIEDLNKTVEELKNKITQLEKENKALRKN